MNALIRKEIRLLAPAWIAAVGLVIIGAWIVPDWMLECFGLGVLLLSLSTFGQEFNLGTFSQLLAQPAKRRQLWNTKFSVLGVAFLSIVLLLTIRCGPSAGRSFENSVLAITIVISVAICASSLWTTLLLRQVTAAFWLAAGIPVFLAFSTASLFESAWLESVHAGAKDFVVAAVLLVEALYAVVSFLFARKLFFSAQDVSWTGGNIGISVFGRQSLKLFLRQNPVSALIHKELQLHMIPIFMALGLTVLSGIMILIFRLVSQISVTFKEMSVLLLIFFWFAIPVMVGGSAVSEERKLNTLEGQLCLPVSHRKQFWIKFLVALSLGVILGAGGPAFMALFAGPQTGVPTNNGFWSLLGGLSAYAAILATAAFYASTLTRSILQSIGATIGVVVLGNLFVLGTVALFAGSRYQRDAWPFLLYGSIGFIILVLAIMRLAYDNFKRLRMDRAGWLANSLRLVVTWMLFFSVSATVYGRAWEFFMTREPKHSQARSEITGAKICSGYGWENLLVLLPDGRVWAPNKLKVTGVWEKDFHGKTQLAFDQTPFPTDGAFLSQTNWIALDAGGGGGCCYGLQGNGTLWKISIPRYKWPVGGPSTFFLRIPPRKIEQIGTDTDWTAISAGGMHCLALKRDGSLWGWGSNRDGQLGIDGVKETNGPVRLGKETNWISIFAQHNHSWGVKADGSVFCWGNLDSWSPNGHWDATLKFKHGEATRWPFTGTNWLRLSNFGPYSVGLRDDGTINAVGICDGTFFGSIPKGRRIEAPQQIGTAEWRSWSGNYGLQAAIKKDGTLWFETTWPSLVRSPSNYRDWTSVGLSSGYVVALAKDGTLCGWASGDNNGNLCLTRQAAWSLNILK